MIANLFNRIRVELREDILVCLRKQIVLIETTAKMTRANLAAAGSLHFLLRLQADLVDNLQPWMAGVDPRRGLIRCDDVDRAVPPWHELRKRPNRKPQLPVVAVTGAADRLSEPRQGRVNPRRNQQDSAAAASYFEHAQS